jgi:UDP-glucose 4-epimerase
VTWLVTGGAGYIGAHVVAALAEAAEDVVVLDDLSSGDATRIPGVPLVVGSVLDAALVARTLAEHRIDGVVHVAAKKQVEESVRLPLLYYRENVEGLRVLLEAVTVAGVGSFVFSSSAAVYGAPDTGIVEEDADCRPVNPYGRTKLIGEQMIAEVAAATGLRHVSLRYFNVAGAGGDAGEDHYPETHLIPNILRTAQGRNPYVEVFGTDYPTPDGTCVRDYVHVADLAASHVAAAKALVAGKPLEPVYNLGSGDGLSVRQIMEAVARVTGIEFTPGIRPRRPGDPAVIVAEGRLAARDLDWQMRHSVDDMVRSAWEAREAAQ